jgi:hypothetical protein
MGLGFTRIKYNYEEFKSLNMGTLNEKKQTSHINNSVWT